MSLGTTESFSSKQSELLTTVVSPWLEEKKHRSFFVCEYMFTHLYSHTHKTCHGAWVLSCPKVYSVESDYLSFRGEGVATSDLKLNPASVASEKNIPVIFCSQAHGVFLNLNDNTKKTPRSLQSNSTVVTLSVIFFCFDLE